MTVDLNEEMQRLARSARMLAMIGAELKLRQAPPVDPRVHEQITAGAHLALGGEMKEVAGDELQPFLSMAEMAIGEAADLLREPARTGAWQVSDPAMLQAQGRASAAIFDRIIRLAETKPSLLASLDGRFLDIGTGVGGIALRAAERRTRLQVDAIDIWPPALSLAAQNFAGSAHAARIRLLELDVAALPPGERYDLAWLPTMFMSRAILHLALPRIFDATRTGGWLVAAMYTIPQDPFAAVMACLRTLRSGGEIDSVDELRDLLLSAGYIDVELEEGPLATLVLGRKAS